MPSWKYVLAATAALVCQTLAYPLKVAPGGTSDIIVTSQNSINGTATESPFVQVHTTEQLKFSFVNNLAGSTNMNAYVTGLDVNNAVVLLQHISDIPDGQYYSPNANGAQTPVEIAEAIAIAVGPYGSTLNIALPGYISSARIWFAEGELTFFVVDNGNGGTGLVEPSVTNPTDPSAAVNWGFVELTNNADGLFANISYVDFVGLVLGMVLTTGAGATQSAQGLQPNAVSEICAALIARGQIAGWPWGNLCVTDAAGTPLRVLAPTDYIAVNPNAFSGYFGAYIDRVWAQYTTEPLLINTQNTAGQVSCQVSNDMLQCAGDNRGYAKPVAADIFGCNSGPFAIEAADNGIHRAVVPRLCAAFDRSTLLLPGGNVQPSLPSSTYNTVAPTNWFSKWVHTYEVDGKGYAFSYDDVNPDGENQSGVVSDPDPALLTIVIGGPLS